MGQSANNPFLPTASDAARTATPIAGTATTPAPPFAASANIAGIGVARNDMPLSADDATYEDAAPSRADLLQRAAALGPARMTWESIILSPSDPILGEKMKPRVAERRARFRKIVKGAVGACAACCLVAAVATAVSSASSPATATSTSSAAVKTGPATGVVPVEKLEVVMRTKAPSKVTAAVRSRAPKKRR